MVKNDKVLLLLALLLLTAFGIGLVRLFQLRFEAGDVYPAYSSLRADPIGTKALYESLQSLPGVAVERYIRALHKLPEGRNTTLFMLGTEPFDIDYLTQDEFEILEKFMLEGGRIVVSLLPSNTKPWAATLSQIQRQKKPVPTKPGQKSGGQRQRGSKPGKKQPQPSDDEGWPGMKLISIKERWGIDFAFQNLPKNEENNYQSVFARIAEGIDLPSPITWHTALYFNKPDTNWQTIYLRDMQSVLIERIFSKGSMVFSADSYYLSNEAMRNERHPDLLAWLVGPNVRVLFDETHLGVMEDPGIATLIRKYRLHGLVIGLVLLAGLFVWRNATSFVPPYEEDLAEARGDAVVGKDSAAGFVNLLRRSIQPAEVLSVCFAEWKKSRAHGRTDLTAKIEQAGAVIAEEQARPARERDAIESYQRISRILGKRK